MAFGLEKEEYVLLNAHRGLEITLSLAYDKLSVVECLSKG